MYAYIYIYLCIFMYMYIYIRRYMYKSGRSTMGFMLPVTLTIAREPGAVVGSLSPTSITSECLLLGSIVVPVWGYLIGSYI